MLTRTSADLLLRDVPYSRSPIGTRHSMRWPWRQPVVVPDHDRLLTPAVHACTEMLTPRKRSAMWSVVLPWFLGGIPEASAQQPREFRLEPTLRIGSLDDPNYSLTHVRDITVDRDGRIYASQPQERTIRVFDNTGIFLQAFGRRGAGPGEFAGLANLGWKGDTLYAVDPDLLRVSYFTRDGELIETFRVESPPYERFRPAGPMGVLRNGTFVAQPPVPPTLGMNGERAVVPILQLNRDGSIVRQVHRLLWRSRTGTIVGSGSVIMFLQPIKTGTLYALAPDGSLVAFVDSEPAASGRRATFDLLSLSPAGDTLLSRAYYYTPREIPATVADSIRTGLVETFVLNGLTRSQAREAVKDHAIIPTYYPPVDRVVVSTARRVWLRVSGANESSAQWIVIDSDGEMRGYTRAQASLEILEVSDTEVWGVTRDELDVPYIVRYRIEG